MSYIGKKPSDITRAIATNDTFTGDGSTTTFTLSQGAASANDLTVVVNNVRQEPGTGSKSYTLTAPTSLVFNTAPAASDEIYVINPTQIESVVRAADISSGAITGQTAETTPADGDTLLMFDASASALRKITKANLVTSAAITANTAKVTNATHTGEVTGATALTIADNAVTLAKMASGTDGNLITYDASGNPAYVATGNAGQILTSAGAGAPPTFAAAAVQGITMADQWRRTAAMTITSTAAVLTANWEQVDTSGQGTIGSAMTQSSGIFTFPSTGLYFILVNQGFYDNSNDSRYFEFKIDGTINNSSYTTQSRMTSSLKLISSYTYSMLTCNTYFNVTDTSQCKVRFKAESQNNTLIGGDTAFNESQSYTFIRLGDSV